MKKTDFSTKTFLMYLAVSFLIWFVYGFLLFPQHVLRPLIYVLSNGLYFDAILYFFRELFFLALIVLIAVFIFKRKSWPWVLVGVYYLYKLLNPLPSHFNPEMPRGSLIALFTNLFAGDPVSAMFSFVASLLPLFIVALGTVKFITLLKKKEYKKLDFVLGVIFMVLSVFTLTNFFGYIVQGYFDLLGILIDLLMMGLLVAGVILWHRFDKK